MKIFRRDPVHPVGQRLWQAGAVLLLIVAVVAAFDCREHLDGSHTLRVGADFLPVYAAGVLVREGRGAELYVRDSIARLEWKIIQDQDLGGLANYGAFLNPPFFAAMYVPFTVFSYRTALTIWVGLNIAWTLAAIVLLCRMQSRKSCPGDTSFLRIRPWLGMSNWKHWGLIPLALVCVFPFREAMMYQQNTFLSLFLLCIIVTLWRRNEPIPILRVSPEFCAGIAMAFLFYKPQLALVIAVALAMTRGWRAVGAMTIMGLLWLAIGLFAMPGATVSFLDNLGPTTRWLQEEMPYHWHQQMTAGCFFRFLFQGFELGSTHLLPKILGLVVSAIFASALIAIIWRNRRSDGASLDRVITASIVTMPLLVPYYMDYDLLLLAVPAVLFSREWIASRSPKTFRDRLLLWTWIAFFLELYINPGLARHTRVNFGFVLLATISALSLARCLRSRVAMTLGSDYDSQAIALAA